MSIADKITSIETHLQADWEAIENLGGSAEDKNIENIATSLNEIYDNLPKTTGESSNLTLTTLKGKMNTTLKGDTSQDGTPTPDTPIDIEVVTGTQEVKVENKNIWYSSEFDATTNGLNVKFTNNKVVLNGTTTSQLDIRTLRVADAWNTYSNEILEFMNANKGTYIASNNSNLKTYFRNANGQYTENTITTSVSNECVEMFVRVPNNTTFTNKDIEVQLEFSSTASEYTPHQEQTQLISLGDIELCKIGTYQDYLYKSNDKWYKKENIGKYNLANITSCSHPSNWANETAFLASKLIRHGISGYGTKADLYCNRFLSAKPNEIANTTQNVIGLGDNNVIYFSITGITTSSGYTTYFQNNETILYYILATANDIEITNTNLVQQLENMAKLYSYNGTTNITSTSDTGCDIILSVSALKGA